MKRFLRAHYELVLGCMALLILAVLFLVFYWGAGLLSRTLGAALGIDSGSGEAIQFKIDEAKSLNIAPQE
jgi:hypothetical protein